MKSERVTLLATPEFKAFLISEAEREGVSVAELVRLRCERRPDADQALLTAATAEVNEAVREARKALTEGLAAADEALAELRRHRAQREPTAAMQRAAP